MSQNYLMGDLYYLLVETPGANLSASMRQLGGIYTQRFHILGGIAASCAVYLRNACLKLMSKKRIENDLE